MGGDEPDAMIHELLDHVLFDRFVFKLSRHFLFVEPIGVFIRALEFIQRHRLVADRGDDGTGVFTESPPTHADDEGDGNKAHRHGQKPRILFVGKSQDFDHR